MAPATEKDRLQTKFDHRRNNIRRAQERAILRRNKQSSVKCPTQERPLATASTLTSTRLPGQEVESHPGQLTSPTKESNGTNDERAPLTLAHGHLRRSGSLQALMEGGGSTRTPRNGSPGSKQTRTETVSRQVGEGADAACAWTWMGR